VDTMLFHSVFKTLEGKEVVVELKNGLEMRGKLHSVDQYMNVKLLDVSPLDAARFPQLACLKNCFVRGSVVRYIQLSKGDIELELLQDAARREAIKSN